jgi:hypothetical protein
VNPNLAVLKKAPPIKEIPHNAHGALTAEFQPPAAC